jgi:hypothetical protein
MKRRFPVSAKLMISVLCALFFSCQKEYNIDLDTPATSTTRLASNSVNLQGNIYDEKGQPASGATVIVGKQRVITDENGYFRIDKAPISGVSPMITVEKDGYFKTFRSFRLTSGTTQLVVQLTKKESIGTITATTGGELALQNGSRVALAAGGVVYAGTGSAYTGNVNVYASYIDPVSPNIGTTVPGSFMATDQKGDRVVLESYGMLAVELESSSGEKLQVAPGKTATVSFAIPSSLLSAAPATIPLWYVDEKTGLWQEEGTATKNGNRYTGTVSHFTFWNADKPLIPVQLTASFKTADNLPLSGACIKLTSKGAVDVMGTIWTDSLGQINEMVPLNQSLLIEILDPCKNIVYSEQLPAITGKLDKGIIRLNANKASVLTVKGRLSGCGSKALNGFAVITVNNMSHYAAADGNGNFSTNFITCSNTNTVQVYGVDLNTFQRGNKITLQANGAVADAGNISSCGMAIDEYLQYELDAVSYKVVDSLSTMFLQSGNNFLNNSNTIAATEPSHYFIARGLSFMVMTGPTGRIGTYTFPKVLVTRVGNYRISTITKADVIFSSFANKANEYFEGMIDVQFTDSSRSQHALFGRFRMMRTEK